MVNSSSPEGRPLSVEEYRFGKGKIVPAAELVPDSTYRLRVITENAGMHALEGLAVILGSEEEDKHEYFKIAVDPITLRGLLRSIRLSARFIPLPATSRSLDPRTPTIPNR